MLAVTPLAISAYISHDLAENGLKDATLRTRSWSNVARVIGSKPSDRDLVLASTKGRLPRQWSERISIYVDTRLLSRETHESRIALETSTMRGNGEEFSFHGVTFVI